MRPELPWNVAGIPQEAREVARAAARREGLTIGEWLTRRIFDSPGFTESDRQTETEDSLRLRPAAGESSGQGSQLREIEEELRAFATRIELAERCQAEERQKHDRTLSDLHLVARKQAQVFEQLDMSVMNILQRVERVERQTSNDNLKDAIKVLHQGLARLTDQVSEQAGHATAQISALTVNLESLIARTSQSHPDAESMVHTLHSRQGDLDERVRAIELLVEQNIADTQRAQAGANAIIRIEERLTRSEAHTPDPSVERRLNNFEQSLASLASRVSASDLEKHPFEHEMGRLGERITVAEETQREVVADLRQAIARLADRQEDFSSPSQAETSSDPTTPVTRPSEQEEPLLLDTPVSAPKSGALPESLLRTMFPQETPLTLDHPQVEKSDVEEGQHAADSYLAAARRSAQVAAAEADTEHLSRGIGGFAWGIDHSQFPLEPRPARYGILGLLALVAICLVVAASLFSQRLSRSSSMSDGTETSHRAAVLAKAEGSKSPTKGAAAPAASNERRSPSVLGTANVTRAPGITGSPEDRRVPSKTMVSPPGTAFRPEPPQEIARLTALANSGSGKAQTVVGLDYLDGNGVSENAQEAAKWLERASEKGQPVAQYRLGTLYESGKGVKADPESAIHWYEAAAIGGNRKAMHNLAVAYVQGAGVSRDYFEAARWFSKAASLGLADSQFNLAVLYERGLGVPQNLLDAYKWYAIAAAQGDAESKARIEAISVQLSADDREAAQRTADQFKPDALNLAANIPPQAKDVWR